MDIKFFKASVLTIFTFCLTFGALLAQDFETAILFTPSNDPGQAQTRSFAGHSGSIDGLDQYDVQGAPPGQLYYAYFDMGSFPNFLWTDSREWMAPYAAARTWTIVISNAVGITTTLTWDSNSIPTIVGGTFTLNGADGSPIDMQATGTATVFGNATLTIDYQRENKDFSVDMVFTPSHDPEQAQTRTFAGSLTSQDGYDPNDQVGPPPPSNNYYAYFDLGTFPTFLWTDSRAWMPPFETPKIWTIVIKNAQNYTTITWNSSSLPSIQGGRFILKGASTANIDMSTTNSTTVTGDAVLTIEYSYRTYVLTMGATPAGGGSTDPAVGPHTYGEGDVVNVTAIPALNYRFANWTGDVANPQNANTTVLMNADKSVTANFVRRYNLTISVNPPAGGITTPVPGTYPHDDGEVVNILASPATGYRFVGWSGDVANPNNASTTVTINDDKNVTANFEAITGFVLTMVASPTAGGSTVPSEGPHTYSDGSVVQISAEPNVGYRFSSWSGDVANHFSPTTTVSMNGDKTVTANFVRRYQLTINSNPVDAGTTYPSFGNHFYDDGEVVNLLAVPAEGYRFVNWSGSVADPNTSQTSTVMDSDKSITANFIRQHKLTVSVNVSEWGSTTPGVGEHLYDLGTVVTLTATPTSSRFLFVNWSGDVADPNSSTTSVTISGDVSVQANFVDTVPVELTAFAATVDRSTEQQGVLLCWETASETNNYGFEIERSFEHDPKAWDTIGFIDGHGTTTVERKYSYIDYTAAVAGCYSYRLKQIDFSGSSELSKAINVTVEAPLEYQLGQNYPNPFNPRTTIAFDLPKDSFVRLVVTNVLGDVVKVLSEDHYQAGHHKVQLNADDLSSGLYLYRIQAGSFVATKKLMLVR